MVDLRVRLSCQRLNPCVSAGCLTQHKAVTRLAQAMAAMSPDFGRMAKVHHQPRRDLSSVEARLDDVGRRGGPGRGFAAAGPGRRHTRQPGRREGRTAARRARQHDPGAGFDARAAVGPGRRGAPVGRGHPGGVHRGAAQRRFGPPGQSTGRVGCQSGVAWPVGSGAGGGGGGRADGSAGGRADGGHDAGHQHQQQEDRRHHRRHQRHRLPDQHPGAERRRGSSARRRAGSRLCGGGQRSAQPGPALCRSGARDQDADRCVGRRGRIGRGWWPTPARP